MSDLFARQPEAPLAERLRPHSLDDVIGQQHLIGEGKPLRVAVEGEKPHSMLLWGPPGVGKTTLARILAQSFNAQFLPVSAVFSGVKDIREAIEKAEIALQQGRATILFVDEVHRFNKAQQDAFLPYVESGLLTFIGATTENPSFEVNPALLSRAQVYVLQSLSSDDLKKLIAKVLALPEYRDFTIEADAQELFVNTADGDARRLLNLIEQLLRAADTRRLKTLTAEFLADSLGAQIRRFDKGGESFYNQISALHKSVRGSHPNAALYWFCRMLDGGTDPRYLARRIVRMAWEDIGKENASDEVPVHLRNAPTKLMKELGYGREYRYAHDEPNAYAAGESYMPDGLDEPNFYQPVPRGLEIKIGEKLKWLKSLDEEALDD